MILDTLVELYADRAVQDELKQALFDHDFNFSKGFIIRSRKLLMPLQRDVLKKCRLLNFNDINSHPSDEDYTFLMPLQRDVLEKCGFLNFND